MNGRGKILVTGGAGYIGSHTVKLLQEQGFSAVVFDSLVSGHAHSVSAPLIVGDLADTALLNKVFAEYPIDAVIHFAGLIIVEESILLPEKYFQNNFVNGLNLLQAMLKHGVNKMVFSSSAAVYGSPHYLPIDEDHPKLPINPYGEAKVMFEKALKWYANSASLSSVSLRYFNAAGASKDASLGEEHPMETHLIPRILQVAAQQQEYLRIFGNDYPTFDGTCVRDYVHVLDLALAHIQALSKLETENGAFVYNVGTGTGHSVAQVVDTAMEVTGKMVAIEYAPRRAGDPAILVADCGKIKQELTFTPQYSDLNTIIETAWNWHKKKYL